MRREEQVTVQGPVKEQQPDGMSHRGANGQAVARSQAAPPGYLCCPCSLSHRCGLLPLSRGEGAAATCTYQG